MYGLVRKIKGMVAEYDEYNPNAKNSASYKREYEIISRDLENSDLTKLGRENSDIIDRFREIGKEITFSQVS